MPGETWTLVVLGPTHMPRVRSYKIRKPGGPVGTSCADPDSSASFMAAGPPTFGQLTLSATPASCAKEYVEVADLRPSDTGQQQAR